MEFAHHEDIVAFIGCQGAEESLTLKQISSTSAAPEAHEAWVSAKGKSSKPWLKLRLNHAKPEKQVRSH
jgi:hypothetical protein